MFNIRRVLTFWTRVLGILLPLIGSLFLLVVLAERLGTAPSSDWQLAARLLVGLLPALLAIAAAFALATTYMRALYDTKVKREAFWHIVHCLFGQANFRPWLMIEAGQINTQLSNPESFVAKYGGPGNMVIRKDSAVVLEQGGRLTRVEGPGFPKLGRFERVYDTLDLRPRRWQFPVSGMSKEGIDVTCETDVNFQIQDGGQQPSGKNPYPMDPNAVFIASTSKWMREESWPQDPKMLDWRGLIVISATEGTVRSILARHPLDRLIAPEKAGEEHPRELIRQELEQALHAAADQVGAKLLSVDLGQIRVTDEVTQQWIESWRADWERWSTEYLAEADAAYFKMVEASKAEASVKKITVMANILHEQRLNSPQAFVTNAKLQLLSVMRNIGTDSLALTYLPAEAARLLQNTANLPPPSQDSGGKEIEPPTGEPQGNG